MTIIKQLDEYITHKQSQIDDLIKRHGHGVRPGWVGEEIAILEFYIRNAIADRNELERNADATD